MKKLIQLSKDIDKLIIRLVKEEKYEKNNIDENDSLSKKYFEVCSFQTKLINIINKIKIDDGIINEIIEIIIKEGCCTQYHIIKDINNDMKRNKINKFKIKNDRQELIEHFKNNLSTINIISSPLLYLFDWSHTKNGRNFYSQLNSKVNIELDNILQIRKKIVMALTYY